MENPEIAVRLNGVTVGYARGAPLFADVSAVLPGPGLVALEGPNGSGKSTLLELLCGHLQPWFGSVSVRGEPPRAGRCRNVTVARTEPAFFRHMTVRDHCHLFSRGTGMSLARITEGLRALDLERHVDQYPEQLSTGTRKKLWFVLHVRQEVDVLAVDEPFNAVDRDSREWMQTELLRRATTALVIVVTHELPSGWQFAGRRPLTGEISTSRIETTDDRARSLL